MRRLQALGRAGAAARVAAALVVALVVSWFLRGLVLALRLGNGRPVAVQGAPLTEIGLDEFKREALNWGSCGRFTADGRLRFSHYRLQGKLFDETFQETTAAAEPLLEPLDLLANSNPGVVSWAQAESLARPGPGLSAAVVVPVWRGGHVAAGWFYDPRYQCLAGLQAGGGKRLGFAGSNGFRDCAAAAGPLGELRLFGVVTDGSPNGPSLAVWITTAGVWIIDLADRQVVMVAPGEVPWSNRVRIFPGWRLQAALERSFGGTALPDARTWSAAVGVTERAGTWALYVKHRSGGFSVWHGGTEATNTSFVTDGTSLFVSQRGSDLTAARELAGPELWPWLQRRMTEPWHAWHTLHRIDANGPVQVAHYDWDVEGAPQLPRPAPPPPPAPGFRAQLNRALLAATVPPALAPVALWCRRLVPSPALSDVPDPESYRSPRERFGRRVGWAYPFSAWQLPWALLFATGVFLHAYRRGGRRWPALAWSIAAAAFGLAGALAYALTRREEPRSDVSPSPALTQPPVLRDAADVA